MKNNQIGRSMIEMLGVLAIIAVLSVGGIAGYGKAIEQFKVNRLIEEYGYVVQQLIEKGDGLRENVKDSAEVFYDSETISAMGFVPNTWKKRGRGFSNSLGHSVIFSSKLNLLSMNTELTIIGQTKGDVPNRVCKELMSKVYKPMHQTIKWITYFGGTEGKIKNFQVDGGYICSRHRKCLKNLTVLDIEEICETCAPKKDIYRCNMIIFF